MRPANEIMVTGRMVENNSDSEPKSTKTGKIQVLNIS